MQMRVGGFGVFAMAGVWMAVCSCGSTARSGSSNGSAGVAGAVAGAAPGAGGGSGGAGATSGAGDGGDDAHAGDAAGGGAAAGAGGAEPIDVGDIPATCESAATRRSHFGCEFWPTIVANPVWQEFSPGVALVNPGARDASVVVSGRDGFEKTVTVAGGTSEIVLLEWVAELKGGELSHINTSGARAPTSARVDGAAYRVVSDVPLGAWQLNPVDMELPGEKCGFQVGTTCRGFSGDGALLLPTSSLTGNYRVLTLSGKNGGADWGGTPGGFALTATQDGTTAHVQLPLKCGVEKVGTSELGACTTAGSGVAQRSAGEIYTLTMNAGDVVQITGAVAPEATLRHADLSGALVNADKPVQIISFTAIANLPDDTVTNSDHIEEVTPPAETFGKRYVVVPPSSPFGRVGHVVRIYGNVDGTQLNYPNGKPAGAPDVINAGEVAHLPPLSAGLPSNCLSIAPHCIVTEPFTVEGNQPFAVASFQVGGVLQSPGTDVVSSQGDPSGSWLQDPSLFRRKYAFFAPDTLLRKADVLAPKGANVLLDGAPLQGGSPLQHGDWTAWSVDLGAGGYHELETDDQRGMSVQVVGFGFALSYYYPAGANLPLISQPPVIVP
jgi:hypothetical protein